MLLGGIDRTHQTVFAWRPRGDGNNNVTDDASLDRITSIRAGSTRYIALYCVLLASQLLLLQQQNRNLFVVCCTAVQSFSSSSSSLQLFSSPSSCHYCCTLDRLHKLILLFEQETFIYYKYYISWPCIYWIFGHIVEYLFLNLNGI